MGLEAVVAAGSAPCEAIAGRASPSVPSYETFLAGDYLWSAVDVEVAGQSSPAMVRFYSVDAVSGHY